MGDSAQGGQERGAPGGVPVHRCGEVGGTRKEAFETPKRLNELSRQGSGLIQEPHTNETRDGLPRTERSMLGLRNQRSKSFFCAEPLERIVIYSLRGCPQTMP